MNAKVLKVTRKEAVSHIKQENANEAEESETRHQNLKRQKQTQ